MNLNLFDSPKEILKQDVVLLRGFALPAENEIFANLALILTQAPLRYMTTPGGYKMSVTMSNCGTTGWTSDAKGYRYTAVDPMTEKPWPVMPNTFRELAFQAATEAGFADFLPDSCLINRYEPGTKLSLHQDKDEKDLHFPIVSVSLGVSAMFYLGGLNRQDKVNQILLNLGDVIIWGGISRLLFHGVAPLQESFHPKTEKYRYNLTFRKAL